MDDLCHPYQGRQGLALPPAKDAGIRDSRDEVYTHLALGRFDGAVCLAWGHGEAFTE